MKKFITKFLSMALIIVLSCGFLSGCELITTDVEADMNQVVATVQLEGMQKEEIKKGQLVSQFNSNGYTYMYYYGYTQTQAYEEILKSLVNDRIIVQQAKLAFTTSAKTIGNKEDKGYFLIASEVDDASATSKDKVLKTKNHAEQEMTTITKNDSADKFLTEYEEAYSKYSVLKSIDSLIESYVDTKEEDEHNHNNEAFSVNARATLSVEEEELGNEWEIKNDDKLKVITEEYKKSFKEDIKLLDANYDYANKTKYDLSLDIYKAYTNNFDLTTKERKKALNNVLKDLKKNGFISSEEAKNRPESVNDLLKVSFFKQALNEAYEDALVSKLELAIENQEEKLLSNDKNLYNEYKVLFDSQKATFDKDYTAYETALENASETSFVVYNPTYKDKTGSELKYGYIANLLIGFNSAQDTALKAFEEKIVGEKIEFRNKLLDNLTAKDMRSTWVLSNYGNYSDSDGKFTFGDDYCKTEALKQFNGTLSGANPYIEHDEYDEEQTKYTFKSVEATEIPFKTFYETILNGIMGFEMDWDGQLTGEGVVKENLISYTLNEDLMTKYRDIIYAYSTDPGSLAENYGYLYSPITSKNKYVKEYAEAAADLVKSGVGSYRVVATEFGYHIMLCTSVIKPSPLVDGTTKITEEEFLSEVGTPGTLPYLFKEYKHNLISSTRISDITSTIINQNSNDKIVSYDKSTYKDLVEEE